MGHCGFVCFAVTLLLLPGLFLQVKVRCNLLAVVEWLAWHYLL